MDLDFDRLIRPSSLPQWADCPRRWAARHLRGLVEMGGYELRRTGTSVGATVGSGVHAGAAETLSEKKERGALAEKHDDAVAAAIAAFDERVSEEGCVFDATTTNRNVAHKQVKRMTITYRQAIAPKIEPILIEERLEASLGDGWRVSGQLDALSQSPGALHDLKTGTRQRSNIVQYGTYAMLFGAHGYDVTTIIEDYLPRVAIHMPQPDPYSTVIPLDAAIAEAYTLIQDVKRQTTAFVELLQHGGAPPFSAFRANPSSALCSDRYCPAWGTTFCRAHLGSV